MPYIDIAKRRILDYSINEVLQRVQYLNLDKDAKAGVINYIISRIVSECVDDVRYADINMMIGVLECAKLELYRRLAVPYENTKITQNGDLRKYHD